MSDQSFTDLQKQLVELQCKLTESSRALSHVIQLISLNQREQKLGTLTIKELSGLPPNIPSYKTVGRMFIREPLPELQEQLNGMLVKVADQIKLLEGKRDYLKKQVIANENELSELVLQIQKLREGKK
eukprot:TRINITY_DN15430_c0_g1_i1.p1 TRINITY_DN15430_c0_g1~~TRINITY_DN15430_c0_g1_i1.p1  ORF type:complete len:144 (+),score=31.97 TRINITY_DN15430_c0_g1_i1:51-434(+)